MTTRDPIVLWLTASLAAGLAGHLALAAWRRRGYARLRAAYVDSVAEVQRDGAPDALVRAEELQREFGRASVPGWLAGLGGHLRVALVLGAVAAGVVAAVAGRLPPVFAGVVLLVALGLRRILVGMALLVLVFVVTSLLSGPESGRPRPPGARVATPHVPHSDTAPRPARTR